MQKLLSVLALAVVLGANERPKAVSSASELDYPPYSIVRDGKADGFSVELLRSALHAMNVDVDFYVDAWSVVKSDLEKGKIDVLPLVGRTPDREALFDFSIPYLVMHGAIVIRNDRQDIVSFEDLKGKQILVMKDDNAHEFLQRHALDSTLVATSSYEEALKMLSAGKGDAVVVQKLVGAQLIRTLKLDNLTMAPELIEGFRQDFSFAVQEGDKELLALLNEGLSLVMANGEYQRLYQKWLAPLEFQEQQQEKVIKLLAILVGLLTVFILLIGFWQRSLKKQVALKTRALLVSEEKLRMLNASLEEKIHTAILELHAKDDLMIAQSRQAAMGEMIAMIAHQWRQPLSVVGMIANNLKLDARLDEEVDIEKILSATKGISSQVAHLSSTIDDFRNFFKPNKDKQTVHLSHVINDALKMVHHGFENNKIAISVDIEQDSVVSLYRNELIQVLINLLNNAKDALIEHAVLQPHVSITVYETPNHEPCLKLHDNAGGIPEHVIHKLGEPYVSTKSNNGTGLGVYMSKTIVEKHLGGSLQWFNENEGATFCIRFAVS